MRYGIKSGALFSEENQIVLATIKSTLCGSEITIYASDGSVLLKADVRNSCIDQKASGGVRRKVYVLENQWGETAATGRPGYAEGDDPAVVGWPVHRLPRTDHAEILWEGRQWRLSMRSSRRYTLTDEENREVLSVRHKGVLGGWTLEDSFGFDCGMLCGLFIFCRYIEQENELMLV